MKIIGLARLKAAVKYPSDPAKDHGNLATLRRIAENPHSLIPR